MMSLASQLRRSQDDPADSDPERDHLIPARKRQHHVRVQGRLAVVRSVSTVNLRPATSAPPSSPVRTGGTTTPATPRFESGVAGSTVPPARRRRSLDDDADSGTEEEHDAKETAVRDRRFRGYGIGGAGNIRRPTEVYGSAKSTSSASRFSYFYAGSSDGAVKKSWSFRELFSRTETRKKKGATA